MPYYTNYIGYKKIGVAPGIVTASTGGAAFPITLVIDAALVLLPALIPWISNAFKHTAKDAIKAIASVKPQFAKSDARQRLALVIATAQKLKSPGIMAEQLFLWYKNTYNEDYKILSIEDKQYYNTYLQNEVVKQGNDYVTASNLRRAMFTNTELYYKAPIENITNRATDILENLTQSPSKVILYTGIGLGLYLILKKQ